MSKDRAGYYPDKKNLRQMAGLPPEEPEPFVLHPKERELIELIRELQYGEIISLRIQHGLPEVADIPLKKVRFTGRGVREE